MEGEPLTGSIKSTLFLRTFFPLKWDQPDKQYSYSSGSSCGTAKAFAERCIREYKCSMLIIDDSQKYPASSPEVLIGLHEMGKSQSLKIVNFRADKVRPSYTREALKSDPRVALYAGVARALPADVCALAMLPARSGGIALYLDSIAVRLTATLTLKPTPIERPTNIQAVSPPPFLLASPNAIARIQRNALIAIVVLVTLLGYFLANVHIPK